MIERRADIETAAAEDVSSAPREPRDPGVDADPSDSPRIGRFMVVRLLGQGGMGKVFTAYDERLDRKVAVKLLRRDVSDDSRARVLREAQAMAKLSHNNVVQVFEVGEHDGKLFIAMEFVAGDTLDVWQRGRTWSELVDAYRQAGTGLAAAHAAGLIHRDFKPQNAVVEPGPGGSPRVRVLDFGIAQLEQDAMSASDEDITISRDSLSGLGFDSKPGSKLTKTGRLLGTPAYMAPEQFLGSSVTPAADQFSMCVALWEALYGQPPFAGDDVHSRVAAVLDGEIVPPPRRSSVPGWLRAILVRGLSVEARDRWPDMNALLAALARDPAQRRRRVLAVTGGLTLVGLGASSIVALQGVPEERCTGAQAQLGSAWNEQTREAVQAAMLGREQAYAVQAAARTVDALDDYAERWRKQYTQSCEATTVRGEQSEAAMDLQVACLHEARRGLSAAASVLRNADDDVVRNAAQVVAGLPPLSRCADLDALRAAVAPPLPREAKRVEEIRSSLALAYAELDSGRPAAARKHYFEAESLAPGTDYAPVQTELAAADGRIAVDEGRLEEAEVALKRALELATRHGQKEHMHGSSTRLLELLGAERHRFAEALQYRELALGLAGDDPWKRAQTHSALGSILNAQGKYPEAEAELRNAIALRIEAKGEEHPSVVLARGGLASAIENQARFDEALDILEKTLTGTVEIHGERHPVVANVHNNLGAVYFKLARYDEAEREFELSLDIRTAAYGERHPDVSEAVTHLAHIARIRGDVAAAEGAYRRALAISEAVLPAGHATIAMTKDSIAGALEAQGKYEEALALAQEVLQERRELLGEEHIRVAASHNHVAGTLRYLQRDEEAERHYRAALAIELLAVGEQHHTVATTRGNLALTLGVLGKLEAAEAELRAAVAALEHNFGVGHPHTEYMRLNLAWTLLEQGRAADALRIAELAAANLPAEQLHPLQRAHQAYTLARAKWDARRSDASRRQARALAEEALTIYEGSQGNPDEAAAIRSWLEAHPSP